MAAEIRPVLTTKYAPPATTPAPAWDELARRPSCCQVKLNTPAAASGRERERADVEEHVVDQLVAPELHSTATVATASGRAASVPKSATPARTPTALTEIEPDPLELERERLSPGHEDDDRR